MKIMHIVLSISLAISCFFTHTVIDSSTSPLIVVVLMVKNEEAVIKKTLQTYYTADQEVQKEIAYVIYDTGLDSWSPTMEKAQEFFIEHEISQYYIFQEPFIDFATSRNRGLRKAEEQFPQAIFLLMPDAEWYLHNFFSLIEFCKTQVNETQFNAYLMRILSGDDLDFYGGRLIRAHGNAYFKGVVHEYICSDDPLPLVPPSIFFQYPAHPEGMEQSKKRWVRDREMLLKEHLAHPDDARTIFYLAQTYACLNDFDNAYYYYMQRTQHSGFVEEDYMAHYRLGLIAQATMKSMNDWSRALQHYLNAFKMRPTRAEPLIRIAHFYFQSMQYELAFLYAQLACQIAYPVDVLFVEKNLYEKIRYEIFTKAAFQIALEISRKDCLNAIMHNYGTQEEKVFLRTVFQL